MYQISDKKSSLRHMLAQVDVDLESIDTTGATVFSFCENNDVRFLSDRLTREPDLLTKKLGPKLQTLLHFAATFNRANAAQLLLSRGASPHAKDVNGNTPLHMACISGGEAVVHHLIGHRADLQAANMDGDKPLHVAAAAGNLAALRCLIHAGVDPTETAASGDSALHAAAQEGHGSTMEYLLQLGLQLDSRNGKGETPLHLAAGSQIRREGGLPVKILLDAGAHMAEKSDDGGFAVHYAAETGTAEALTYLLDRGCPVLRFKKEAGHWVEDTRRTLLQCVAESGSESKAHVLLERIMRARHELNRSQCVAGMSGSTRRKRYFSQKMLNQQELALSGMYKEFICDPENPDSLFRTLLQRTPKAVEQLLDSCLITDLGRPGMFGQVSYDFFLFYPGGSIGKEMAILDIIIATGKINLLEHPLIETFFELKWWRIWRAYCLVMFAFLCHTVATCGYAIMEFGRICTEEVRENQKYGWWLSLLIFNTIFFILILGKIISFVTIRASYRGHLPRYSCRNRAEANERLLILRDLVTPVLTYAFLFSANKELAVIIILSSGYQFMNGLTRVPRVGVHVFMTEKVFWTIFEFFLSYLVEIFGFALVFHILLPEGAVYSNLGDSFIKVLTMLLGEFDYAELVATEAAGWLTRVVFVFFLLTMSIVLMNLLVGLAISDIESMRKDANIHKMISTLVAVRTIEEFCNILNRIHPCRFLKHTVTSQDTCLFKEKVYTDLKDIDYAKTNRVTISRGCEGGEVSYPCSKRILLKVADIVRKRWLSEMEGEERTKQQSNNSHRGADSQLISKHQEISSKLTSLEQQLEDKLRGLEIKLERLAGIEQKLDRLASL